MSTKNFCQFQDLSISSYSLFYSEVHTCMHKKLPSDSLFRTVHNETHLIRRECTGTPLYSAVLYATN